MTNGGVPKGTPLFCDAVDVGQFAKFELFDCWRRRTWLGPKLCYLGLHEPDAKAFIAFFVSYIDSRGNVRGGRRCCELALGIDE